MMARDTHEPQGSPRASVAAPSASRPSRGTAAVRARAPRALAMAAAVIAAFGVSACSDGSGFRPLYGTSSIGGGNANAKLAQISIVTIPGRVGQRIRNELIFQTTGGAGETVDPVYSLDIAIRETVSSTLVRVDGEARSQIYNLDAAFKLVRNSDKAVVLQGTSFSRAGFERNVSIFSNVRAKEDAENRAATTVAQDIRSRLAAFLSAGT